MRGLILAGGKGTRLRPLTIYTPKPIVPLVNRPFLLYQLDFLKHGSIEDVTLSLSYLPEKIEQVVNERSDLEVSLDFVTESHPMGTAGAFRFAVEDDSQATVILNGDILTDIELSKIIAFHREKKAEATIAVKPVKDPSLYGLVETDEEGRVVRFLEKPKGDQLNDIGINTINAGIYIFEPSILNLIPQNENRSFEYHIFPEILERNMAFYAYDLKDAYWRDIGKPESYLAANADILNGKVKTVDLHSMGLIVNSEDGNILNSIVGKDCHIKPNTKVINSVIGSGVHIDEKCVIENSVIWSHSRISAHVEIKDSFIGRSGIIGRNAIIDPGTVLGDKVSIPDYSVT